MRRLYLAAERSPARAGLIGPDGRLEGYWRFGNDGDGPLGARFLGRVVAIDRGLEAAFVEIGLERPGFLPLSQCIRPPVEGESIAVEVTRAAAAGKGVRLTARLGAPPPVLPAGGRAPIRLPAEPPLPRLVRRLGGELDILVDARRVAEELAAALAGEPRLAIAHRAQRDWPIGLAEMEAEAAAALEPRVELPSGGWLLFEPCQALTVVDVNSGAFRAGGGGERAWLKIDLEAAAAVARQLRLRHIGGIVVVDFIDLKSPTHRREVSEALRAAVAGDWEPCWVGAMSRLGLVEMTRRRGGPTLADMLAGALEGG